MPDGPGGDEDDEGRGGPDEDAGGASHGWSQRVPAAGAGDKKAPPCGGASSSIISRAQAPASGFSSRCERLRLRPMPSFFERKSDFDDSTRRSWVDS